MQDTVAATLEIFADTPNLNAWMWDRLRPWAGQRVVEVGSGLGTMTDLLRDRELVVATEIDDSFLARLRARFAGAANVVVERLDLEDVRVDALRAHRADTILCVNVLEHVRDDAGALARLGQAVGPGGRLLLYVPALPWLYGSLDRGLLHHRRYGRAELMARLAETGWRVLHISWMNVLGIPGWFLSSRILRRNLLPSRQVSLYDRLTPILRLEDHLRLPIGMSLVCAAERPLK